MPKDIKPMLAQLAEKPFDGDDWLFETKWDGYRAIAEIDCDRVKLYSRNFSSFNSRFRNLLEPLQQLGVRAILDGEIIVLDRKGRSSFQSLQNYQKTGVGDLFYCIFDFLYFEGYDLRELPLIERKKLLKKLLSQSKSSALRYSDHILIKGKKAFAAAKKRGEEGVIAKRIKSHYVSARSSDWLKIKVNKRQEAIICGFTKPKGSRKKFGALLLGIYKDNKLHFCGKVGTGFDSETLTAVSQELIPLITKNCPFETIPKNDSSVTWVKAKIICEVSFYEWTAENRMRQPVFHGLRTDKKVKEVKKEIPLTLEGGGISVNKFPKKKGEEDPPLTNLEKIYWPHEGYTKGLLIDYYRQVADYILPYLRDRPQSLYRFPNGIEQPGFFQKNISDSFPEWVPTHLVRHSGKEIRYMMIQDKKTLLFAINLGCIDLNPFSSRIDHLNHPDFVIFDLDPEDISFEAVRRTALVLHEILEKYGIPNFCKTSGAKGLHVLVPIEAKYSYEQAKLFAELISYLVHERLPDITSLERSPTKRKNKVYLDFLQNSFGQTIASPYCVRPQPGASVSAPLEWSEVKKKFLPSDFTIRNMVKRLEKKGDIFKPVLGKGIDLDEVLKILKSALQN